MFFLFHRFIRWRCPEDFQSVESPKNYLQGFHGRNLLVMKLVFHSGLLQRPQRFAHISTMSMMCFRHDMRVASRFIRGAVVTYTCSRGCLILPCFRLSSTTPARCPRVSFMHLYFSFKSELFSIPAGLQYQAFWIPKWVWKHRWLKLML